MRMLKLLVSNNIALLLLGVIIAINASRIFYFPLPKIHSSHELKQEPPKEVNAERSINYEFIPFSAMERNMYEEQEGENERSDTSDWDGAMDKDTAGKRLIAVKEFSSEHLRRLDSLDRDTRKPLKTTLSGDDVDEAIDTLLRLKKDRTVDDSWLVNAATERTARLQADSTFDNSEQKKRRNDALFLVIVGTSSLVGIVGLIAAAIFWYKIQRKAEAALDSEYPSYGVTGPGSSGSTISPSATNLDRKLAHSAQMFHYQQQRQQMIAQEKTNLEAKPVHSDDSDDEAHNGGDYTVYECPGLAPTGEMEVRNPLFSEPDSSLTSHPATNNHYPQPSSSSSPPKEKSLS